MNDVDEAVKWARDLIDGWPHIRAKPLDPSEPSFGRKTELFARAVVSMHRELERSDAVAKGLASSHVRQRQAADAAEFRAESAERRVTELEQALRTALFEWESIAPGRLHGGAYDECRAVLDAKAGPGEAK